MKFISILVVLVCSWSALAVEPISQSLVSKFRSGETIRVLVRIEKRSGMVIMQNQKSLQSVAEFQLYSFLHRHEWMASLRPEVMWLVPGIAVDLNIHDLKTLISDPEVVEIVDLNEPVYLENSMRGSQAGVLTQTTYGVAKVGARALQEKHPELLGTGVRVGVIDTGIDANHPDLKDRIVAYKDFSPSPKERPSDDIDHGTHIAGTIAGGSKSREQIGVAPGAELIIAKIFNKSGESTKELILQAMHWVVDPDGLAETDDGATIVNSSWASRSKYDTRNPEDVDYCGVVQSWSEMGVIPVFAAGNNGPADASIGLPAGCPETFSVGASEHNDRLMYFSAVGPARWESLDLEKPDVVAPGFWIKSARAGGGYRDQTGTSMSAPHVAGAFALLRQAFPEKSANELMSVMRSTAVDLGREGYDYDFGWGRIDVEAAHAELSGESQE